jgi:hypothetical protein
MKQNLFYATLLMAATLFVFSCQKDSTPIPQKDLADHFVGRYIGNYRENVFKDVGSLNNSLASHGDTLTINKLSANEVSVHFENRYYNKKYDIKGIVLRDTFMEIPIQVVDNQQLKIGDKCVMTRLQGADECSNEGLDPTALKFSLDLTFYSKTTLASTHYFFLGQKK